MVDEPSMLRSPLRPLDPARDAVIGPAGLQERHRLARMALLQLLLDYEGLRPYWRAWCENDVHAPTIAALDALAVEMDLPGRAALWDGDETLYRDRRDAIVGQWIVTMTPMVVDLFNDDDDSLDVALKLASRLQLRYTWLALELQWLVIAVTFAHISNRPVTLHLTIEEPSAVIQTRTQPGESESEFLDRMRRLRAAISTPAAPVSRMPKDALNVRQKVVWLMRNRLDGISVRQLAHEYEPTKSRNGRTHVRKSINLARVWLNAVPPFSVGEEE